MDIPKNLSDSWLEKEYDALSRSLKSGDAVLNFEKVVWVELSALINLTAIIIKHKEKLKRLDFLFDAFNRAIGSKESLRFLLESHFYLAIESSIKDDDILFYIWFKTPSDKADDALNLKNKFLYYLQGDVASEDEDPVTIHKNKFGKIFIALDVKKLRKGRRVDASFFSIFGYQVWHPRDSFIVPITHICNEEIPKYLQFDLENPPQKTLVDDLQLGINVFPEKTKTILDELNQLWLYEFIHNAFEHGEKNVIFCARLGSWEVRQKFTKNLNIDGEGYLYRKKFLKRQPHRGLDLYIDLYVVDFGKGFISLKDAYEKENGPLKGKHKIKKLHRYSLFHHSSRKHLNRIEDSIYSTGLGMISEQIVTNDAMLSIKDKDALTYFEKQSIERLSDQGATEILSTSDFGFTSISAILPIPDDAWLSRNRVISFDTNDGYIDKIIIIKSPVNESVFPDKCILVGNNYSGKYEILKEVPLGEIDLLGKWPIVFDMVNSRPTYKYMASRIVDKFFEWRNLGNPFFVSGVGIADMKIFQSIIEGHGAKSPSVKPFFQHDDIFCIMLTDDLKVFLCGRLNNETRDGINSWITKKSNLLPKSKKILSSFGLKDLRIPFRTIDRILNRIHGEDFLYKISSEYFTNEPVLDTHGNILTGYYEVKTFLDSPEAQQMLAPDLRRAIQRYKADLVVVDCPELARLSEQAAKTLYYPPRIAQLENGVVDIPLHSTKTDERFSSVLVFISAAFQGTTLNSIKRLHAKGWPIVAVNVLLDMTDKSTETLSKEFPFKYDRLAIAKRPKLLSQEKHTPKFIASAYARLIPADSLKRQSSLKFRSAVPTHANFSLLHSSNAISVGHIEGHKHHYDVYIDLRKSIASNDRLCQMYRGLVRRRIETGYTVIVYPEESNLASVLDGFRLGQGNKPIEKIVARHVFDDTYIWRDNRAIPDLNGKKVIITDESMHSGATIRGLIKLVKSFSPDAIDVVVIQKRISTKSSTGELERIPCATSEDNSCNFYCVIDLHTPVWSSDNCPYCKMNFPYKAGVPKKLSDSIIIQNISIETDADFILWFNQCLYRSRESALSAITHMRTLDDKYLESLVLAADMIMVNSEEIFRWRLIDRANELLRKIISIAGVESRCNILEKMSFINISIRWHFLKYAFTQLLPEINDPRVYLSFMRTVENNKNFADNFENIVTSRYHSNTVKSKWNSIKTNSLGNNFPQNVFHFFALTKINRAIHHERLSSEINQNNIRNISIKGKLDLLSHITKKLGDFDGSSLLLLGLENKDSNTISRILSSDEFVKGFNNQFCVLADNFLKDISEAVGHDSDSKFEKEIQIERKGSNGMSKRVDQALLCIQPWVRSELVRHLTDNRKQYGKSTLSCKRIPTNNDMEPSVLEIKCISHNLPTVSNISEARSTSGYCHVRYLLGKNGVIFDYELIETVDGELKFLTKLSISIVDYIPQYYCEEGKCININ